MAPAPQPPPPDLPDKNSPAKMTRGAASPHLTSLLSSPSCASPAKARMRLDCDPNDNLESQGGFPFLPHNTLCASITSFTTSNQPVMDTLLKDMLVSLQQSMHTDTTFLSQKFSAEVSSLGEHVNSVENSVSDITTTVNDLVDENEDGIEKRQWLWAKIAYLELQMQ